MDVSRAVISFPTEFNVTAHVLSYAAAMFLPVVALHRISRLLWLVLAQDVGVPKGQEGPGYSGLMPALVGIVERFLYMAAIILGFPAFIGFWLAFKVAGGWSGWSEGRDIDFTAVDGYKRTAHVQGRSMLNTSLLTSGLSIVWSIAGTASVLWWQQDHGDFATAAIVGVATATLALWGSLSLRYRLWARSSGANPARASA